MSAQNHAQLKLIFSAFDKDNDGFISAAEFDEVFSRFESKMSREEIDALILAIDTNKDGKVNFEEFCDFASGKTLGGNERNFINCLFRLFDKNNDGYITKQELKDVMESFGSPVDEAVLSTAVSSADLNNDGRINYEEFLKAMNN